MGKNTTVTVQGRKVDITHLLPYVFWQEHKGEIDKFINEINDKKITSGFGFKGFSFDKDADESLNFIFKVWYSDYKPDRMRLGLDYFVYWFFGVNKSLLKTVSPPNYSKEIEPNIPSPNLDLASFYLMTRHLPLAAMIASDDLKGEAVRIYNYFFKDKILAWTQTLGKVNSELLNDIVIESIRKYTTNHAGKVIAGLFPIPGLASLQSKNHSLIHYKATLDETPARPFFSKIPPADYQDSGFFLEVFHGNSPNNRIKAIENALLFIGFNDYYAIKSTNEKGETTTQTLTLEEIAKASLANGSDETQKAFQEGSKKLGVDVKDLSDPRTFVDLLQCYLINSVSLPYVGVSSDGSEIVTIPSWLNMNQSGETDPNQVLGNLPPGFFRTNGKDQMMNYLTSKRFWGNNGTFSQDFASDSKDDFSSFFSKRLFWIFEDGGEIRQEEIFLNRSRTTNKYWDDVKNKDKEAADWDLNRIMTDSVFANSNYDLEKINLKFEGTNPSTARKDVQVEMVFKMSSMEVLDCPVSKLIEFQDGTIEPIRLFHLVTLPNEGKIAGSKEFDSPRTEVDEYSPEYSRVRLVVSRNGDSDDDDSIIIDLTTIDHNVSRDGETGETTFTINYRGFFEGLYSMPSSDVLSTDDFREKRDKIKSLIKEMRSADLKCDRVSYKLAKNLEKEWEEINLSKIKSNTIGSKSVISKQ